MPKVMVFAWDGERVVRLGERWAKSALASTRPISPRPECEPLRVGREVQGPLRGHPR